MPFLAPALPFLIQAGAGIGSSLLGSKLSGGAGGLEKQQLADLLKGQMGSISQGRELASSLGPQANNILGMATRSFSPVAGYWSGLLSGNRSRAMGVLAPEISRINEGYDAANRQSAALSPRGGPSAAFLSETPFM